MSSKKKIEKSPYRSHSIEEVLSAESGKYVIQIGSELLTTEEGKMAFSRDRAEVLYNQVLEGLLDMSQHGNKEEQNDAKQCMLFLRIHPLRFH